MNNHLLKENKVHGSTLFPLAIYELKYNNNNIAVDCHWHYEFEFLTVIDGSLDFIIGNENVTVNTGDSIFINSGELHTGYMNSDNGCSFRAVVFNPELLFNGNPYDPIKEKYIEPLLKGNYILPKLYRKEATAWENNLSERLSEIFILTQEKKFCYEMSIKSGLYDIFSTIFSNTNLESMQKTPLKFDINSERLKRVMEYIYLNYNSKISIKALSGVLNMSEGHFIRFFKQMVRKTPVEYINYYRVNKAVLLLEESDKKIIEISGDTGFENVSYFVTIFKHYMDCTPAEYRKKLMK